jgi:GNAT superfamily N-acetyltransferase
MADAIIERVGPEDLPVLVQLYNQIFRPYGVVPEFRRKGVASQLMDAVHSWARQNEYESIRFECHNQHRPMLHLAIALEYDIVGIRWDPDRGDNLVIFEKVLTG